MKGIKLWQWAGLLLATASAFVATMQSSGSLPDAEKVAIGIALTGFFHLIQPNGK